MSLINEALKKAEARQGGGPLPSGPSNLPPAHHGGPPRKSFPNWWVLFALLIVFGISVAGATWLILWGMQDKEGPEVAQTENQNNSTPPASNPASSAAGEDLAPIAFKAPEAVEPPASVEIPEKNPEPKPTVPSPEPVAKSNEAASSNLQPPTANSSEAASSNLQSPTSNSSEAASGEAATEEPTPEPIPEVQDYLTKLEIRGIMSGGEKVLIFQPELSRTLSYRNGSEMQAPMKIWIHNVYEDRIAFRDDGGFIYIKRF